MPRQGLDRSRVIAEAAALADSEGAEALSLATLAARLGVRAPSLYKHIEGLEALRTGVAILAVNELGDVLATAIAGRSGRDALEAFGRAYVTYARAHPGSYPLTLRAPDPADTAHTIAAERVIDLVRAMLRPIGLEGEAETHAIRSVRAALHGFCALEAAGGFGMPLSRDASLDGLLAILSVGLGADGAPSRG